MQTQRWILSEEQMQRRWGPARDPSGQRLGCSIPTSFNWISENIAPTICKNCNRHRHTMNDCCHLGKPKCTNCNWFRHLTKECYSTQKHKQDHESLFIRRGDASKHVYKVCKTIQTSQVAENVNKELAIFIEEAMSSPPSPQQFI